MGISGLQGDKYDFSRKTVIGLVEEVTIRSSELGRELSVLGRIDTGATVSSIHADLVKELNLGPAIKVRKVKNANGISLRPVIEVNICLHNKELTCRFTVSDRTHMKYKVLIGRNILKNEFLIDPSLGDLKVAPDD